MTDVATTLQQVQSSIGKIKKDSEDESTTIAERTKALQDI